MLQISYPVSFTAECTEYLKGILSYNPIVGKGSVLWWVVSVEDYICWLWISNHHFVVKYEHFVLLTTPNKGQV